MKKAQPTANTRGRTRIRGDHAASQPSAGVRTERRRSDHETAELATTDSFQLFLNQASRYPLLRADEELELAKRIERGDLEAKEQLINSNLRLVVSIARRYQGFGLPLQDLVQEAMPGLIRAAEKFDWRRGYKFSTYATLWIRQSIQRGLDNTGREIRVPANVAQQLRTLNRTEAELTAKLDHEPTDQDIADNSRLSVDEVGALRDLARVTTSLDAEVGGDGDATLGDFRADEAPSPDEDVIDRQRTHAIEAALASLPESERRVIQMRFGTGGEPESTLREVGSRLGITQERARQLEARGLERLARTGSLEAWREAA